MTRDDWNWHTEQALDWLSNVYESVYLRAKELAAIRDGARLLKMAYGGRHGYIKMCDPQVHVTKVNWELIKEALVEE